MRYFVGLLCLLISTSVYSQTVPKLKGKPDSLEETYLYLNQIFSDTEKYGFMTLPEDVATRRLHQSFGIWIRNNWGLWKNHSPLKQYFLDRGVGHPDDMSAIILTSYHRFLNSKPINFDTQARTYQEFYKGIIQKGDTIFYSATLLEQKTPDSLLVKYFPIGDNIHVSIYASERRWFTTYASGVTATAVVQEHHADKILVQIISIEEAPGKKPVRKTGEVYEENPAACSLIPPTGWVYKKEASAPK